MYPYGSVDSLVYDHLDQPTVSLDNLRGSGLSRIQYKDDY